MESVAIIIASCDKNIWLLDIFFEYFYKFWSDCPYRIYVSLEKAALGFYNKDIIVLNDQTNVGWSGRIRHCLEEITEEYVLVMLDDFIIEEKVEQKKLDEYISIVKNENLSNLILTPVSNEKNDMDSKHESIFHRNRFGRYKTSLQCGIWDKSVLHHLLKREENAWEFEIFGNIRSFQYRNTFYAVKTEKDKPIVYNDGFFMVQGKVNLKEKRRIEQKTGGKINVENIPGFEDNMVRDNIKPIPRIVRRLKIMLYYSIGIIKYALIKEKCREIR